MNDSDLRRRRRSHEDLHAPACASISEWPSRILHRHIQMPHTHPKIERQEILLKVVHLRLQFVEHPSWISAFMWVVWAGSTSICGPSLVSSWGPKERLWARRFEESARSSPVEVGTVDTVFLGTSHHFDIDSMSNQTISNPRIVVLFLRTRMLSCGTSCTEMW